MIAERSSDGKDPVHSLCEVFKDALQYAVPTESIHCRFEADERMAM